MANRQAISATISKSSAFVVNDFVHREAKTRSAILDQMIQGYYREWLRKELAEAAATQDSEDRAMAEENMGDYLKIIDRDEG